MAKTKEIAVSQLKAQLFSVIDAICRDKNSILVTKRGVSVARIIPIEEEKSKAVLGKLLGTVVEEVDLIVPIGEDLWQAET